MIINILKLKEFFYVKQDSTEPIYESKQDDLVQFQQTVFTEEQLIEYINNCEKDGLYRSANHFKNVLWWRMI